MADQNQGQNQVQKQNQKPGAKDASQMENTAPARAIGAQDQTSKGTTNSGLKSGSAGSETDDEESDAKATGTRPAQGSANSKQ